MSLEIHYNLKSPGVKRLMREACELAEPTEEYCANPLEDNLFEWHFTVQGPPNTEFEGGLYHGRILLPSQYPMQPPNIILLTPNGRFETNKKICLSISGYHPESWQPSWSIRTALLALIAFMPTRAAGTIGSLDYTKEEREVLAKKSKNWECSICGKIGNKLSSNTSSPLTLEETSLLSQIALKAEEDTNKFSLNDVIKTQPFIEVDDTILSTVRERALPVDQEKVEENSQSSIRDELLQVSVDRTNKDKVWCAVIWLLILLIILLIIRRFFFL